MTFADLLRPLKFRLIGREVRPRRIRAGAAKGLVMTIDPAAKTQRIFGLDEREIQPDFLRCAHWAEVLVDVGSSDAYYGLIFHRHNPDAEIHMIDANRDFLPLQKAHFSANFPEAKPHHHIKFVVAGETADPNHCVLARDLPLRHRRLFLKVDVDGWEMDVLRSAEGLFADTPVRTIIETHSPELEQACLQFLRDHQFSARVIRNAWWRIAIPEKRPDHNRWIYAENTVP
jgi:hypothetical protein